MESFHNAIATLQVLAVLMTSTTLLVLLGLQGLQSVLRLRRLLLLLMRKQQNESRSRSLCIKKNTDHLIQAYTAEYKGRYRQIQSDKSKYEFQIRAYVTVCSAQIMSQIQADTSKHELQYQFICAWMQFHNSFCIQRDMEKPVNLY
jgi:hypothetical protein